MVITTDPDGRKSSLYQLIFRQLKIWEAENKHTCSILWCTKKHSQWHRNHTKKVTIPCKMSQMTMTPAFNDMIARGGNLIAFEIFTNKVALFRNCTQIML